MLIKSFFMKIHNQVLNLGLLHESHRLIEKISGYILFGSFFFGFIFLVLGMISRFLLGGLFEGIIMICIGVLVFTFWTGIIMVILSTNKII